MERTEAGGRGGIPLKFWPGALRISVETTCLVKTYLFLLILRNTEITIEDVLDFSRNSMLWKRSDSLGLFGWTHCSVLGVALWYKDAGLSLYLHPKTPSAASTVLVWKSVIGSLFSVSRWCVIDCFDAAMCLLRNTHIITQRLSVCLFICLFVCLFVFCFLISSLLRMLFYVIIHGALFQI